MLTPDEDIHWMKLALKQASNGVGTTSPNPPVGAVIVKGGKLIGKGWHQRTGGPHAEREAIADVLKQHQPEALNGATIYVTLEPCSSHGLTPPCTDGIIAAGITRLVYGSQDPNPKHVGVAKTIMQLCRVRSAQRCLSELHVTNSSDLLQRFSKQDCPG